jgi:hypothetical protein
VARDSREEGSQLFDRSYGSGRSLTQPKISGNERAVEVHERLRETSEPFLLSDSEGLSPSTQMKREFEGKGEWYEQRSEKEVRAAR